VFGALVALGVVGCVYIFSEYAAPAGPYPGVLHAGGGMIFATSAMILGVELSNAIFPKEEADDA
jgi:hypothetical protein